MPILFIFGSGLLLTFRSKKDLQKIVVCGLLLLSLSFGTFRHSYFNFKNESILSVGYNELSVIIIEEPEIKSTTKHLKVRSSEGEKILLITDRYFEGDYYDLLSIKGEFHKPEPFEGFDYPGYLAKEGIYLVSFYPKIEITGKENHFLFSKIFSFKQDSRRKIYSHFAEPHASILAAMILGDKNNIPENWQKRLSVSGVRHITAVSGLHITVLLIVSLSLGTSLGVDRRWASIMAIIAVFLFIIMIGGHSSAIRAGIMGSTLIFARLLGRMSDGNRIIVLVATAMLLINPLLLKHDIGFQLSFMAVIGIMNYSDFFKLFLRAFPGIIKETLAASFSAYLFTFPLIGHYFGEASLVFPLTNILILPLVYWIMIFGMGFIFLGSIGVIFIPFIWILLIYSINVVYLLSSLSISSIEVSSFAAFIIFIAFYLKIGSTKKIAEKIKTILEEDHHQVDIEEVRPVKSHNSLI